VINFFAQRKPVSHFEGKNCSLLCFENSDFVMVLRYGITDGHFEITDFDLDQIESLRDAIDITLKDEHLHYVIETPNQELYDFDKDPMADRIRDQEL
jgi:hypothetical protein